MQWVIDLVGLLPPVPAKNDMMIWGNIICKQIPAKQSPISSVLRETQGDGQSVLRETQGAPGIS
ncbi:unnamed protein product [Prunus armeniaca]